MNLAKCMVFHLNEGEEFAKQITSSSDNATQFIQGFLGVLVFKRFRLFDFYKVSVQSPFYIVYIYR